MAQWPEGTAPEDVTSPFHCGERIRAVVRLVRPGVFHDPGAWNREEYLLDQGITSSATIKAEQVDRIGSTRNGFGACWFSSMQRATTARLSALPVAMQNFPEAVRWTPDEAILVAAMAAGPAC